MQDYKIEDSDSNVLFYDNIQDNLQDNQEQEINYENIIKENIPEILSFPFNFKEDQEKDKQPKVVIETHKFRKGRLLNVNYIDESQIKYLERCYTTYNLENPVPRLNQIYKQSNIVVSQTASSGNDKRLNDQNVLICDKEYFTIGNLDQELVKQNQKYRLRLNEVFIKEDQMSSVHLYVDYKWNYFHDDVENKIAKALQSVSYKDFYPTYKTFNRVINSLSNWNNNKIKVKDISVRGNSTQVEIRDQEESNCTYNKLLNGTRFFIGQEVKMTIRCNYEHFYQFILSQHIPKQQELYAQYLYQFVSQQQVVIIGMEEVFDNLMSKVGRNTITFQDFYKELQRERDKNSTLQQKLYIYFNKSVYFVKNENQNTLVFEGSKMEELDFQQLQFIQKGFLWEAETEANSRIKIEKYNSLTVLLHINSAPPLGYIKQVYDVLNQIRSKIVLDGLDESLLCLLTNIIDKTITFEEFNKKILDEENNNFHHELKVALGKSALLIYIENDTRNQYQYFLLIEDKKKSFPIGRGVGNSILFYQGSTSRYHGMIEYSKNLGWRIIDGQNDGQQHKRSTLGTWRVLDRDVFHRIELNNERKIKVGQTCLRFSIQKFDNQQQ